MKTVEARRRRLLPIDIAVAATVVFAGIPQYFTLNMRVADIPVMNGFYLSLAFLVAFYYWSAFPLKRRLVTLYTAGAVYLILVSGLYWMEPTFDSRYFLQDIAAYVGLPVGAALAQLFGRDKFFRALHRWYLAATITFAAGLLSLLLGYVPSRNGPERLLDEALYYSASFVMISFPSVWCSVPRATKLQRSIALAAMGICITFTVLSATRSVFITFVVSLICTATIEWKRNPRVRVWLVGFFVVALVVVIGGSVPGAALFENTLIGERFSSTEVQSESRYEEVAEMLGQMGPAEWIHGVGFGTGFESSLAYGTDSGRSFVPHIAILTLLYKGGAGAFVLLMLAPCLIAVFRFLLHRNPGRDPFLAAVIIYFVLACLSGGWSFFDLFLLGVFLELGLGDFVSSRVPMNSLIHASQREEGTNVLLPWRLHRWVEAQERQHGLRNR